MHGVTEAVIVSLAEPHWHDVSVNPQEVDAIAVAKQETCQFIISSCYSNFEVRS